MLAGTVTDNKPMDVTCAEAAVAVPTQPLERSTQELPSQHCHATGNFVLQRIDDEASDVCVTDLEEGTPNAHIATLAGSVMLDSPCLICTTFPVADAPITRHLAFSFRGLYHARFQAASLVGCWMAFAAFQVHNKQCLFLMLKRHGWALVMVKLGVGMQCRF